MLLGYEIIPNDNDEFFIEDEKKLPKEYLYKNTYEYNQLPKKLKMKRRKMDIGGTYDLFIIVSGRFKKLCEENHFGNLEFIQLPADINFYLFRVNNILEFDTEKGLIECQKFSKEYNKYEWIHGGSPVCLKNKQPVPEGTICRTDIFFGAGIRKSPVLMVGIKTKELMESWKLKGIYFNKILDEYPWQKKPEKEKPRGFLRRFFK